MRRLAVLMVVATLAIAACGDDDGDRSTFCTTADQLGSDSGLLTGDVTRAELDELAGIYQELVETAPGAIRDDVQFLRDAVDKLREGDVSFVIDEEQAARLTDAFEGVSDYLREQCPRPQPSTGALRSRPGR